MLTNGPIGDKGLVVEAEELGDIVEVRVLDDKGPLCVVQAVVEVGDGDLGTPVVLVVELHMPVHADGAHMVSALQQWSIVLPRCVDPSRCQQLRVASVASFSARSFAVC